MNIFKKKPNFAGEQDASLATDSIDALRASLADGAAQQELAAKRLAGLSDAIARLDASRREAARLSTETDRLAAELKSTKSQLDAKTAWANEQSSKYTTIKSERDALRRDLESAREAKSKSVEALELTKAHQTELVTEIGSLRSRLKAETERAELADLARARMTEQDAKRAAAYKAQSIKLAETTRSNEDLSARLADKTSATEAVEATLRDLRVEHAATKEKLIEALNALQSAEYKMQTADSAHAEALARRSDEITALRRQVEQLSAELRIKDGVGQHYDRDLATLRSDLGSERERADALQARLRDANGVEERQASALAKAKIDYDQLAEKFSDALRDIEALRKVNLMQRKTLERYAEVGGAAAPKSHTSPEPMRPVRVVKGSAA
jgi:chromosome segregation ATPase